MSSVEIIILAVSLSMDAFAIAIAIGLSVRKAGLREMALTGLYFGLAQALMPSAGWLLGRGFADKIASIDHWIAFTLLGFIGGKMIKDSFAKNSFAKNASSGGVSSGENPLHFTRMLPLALADSIDALAAGVTFAFFPVNVPAAVLIIGAVTFLISMCGVKIGALFGLRFKAKAEFAGGAALILLGAKILFEALLR